MEATSEILHEGKVAAHEKWSGLHSEVTAPMNGTVAKPVLPDLSLQSGRNITQDHQEDMMRALLSYASQVLAETEMRQIGGESTRHQKAARREVR